MSRVFENKEIIEMCQIIAEQEQLKVTIQESVKAGFFAGCSAIVGGILGGPVGVAIGGICGSVTSAAYYRGKFRSVGDILKNDLTHYQKQKLLSHMRVILAQVKPEDYISLLTLVLTSASIKEVIIKELGVFLLKELNLKMVQ